MRVARFPLALLALAAGTMLMPVPGWAQNDPAAMRLIEQLRPRAGGATRGIRLPSAETTPAPAPAPAPASSPASSPAQASTSAPDGTAAVRPAAPAPPSANSQRPAMQAPVVPDTTAPEGMAAVSITVTFPSGSATLTPQAAARLAPLGRALSSAELAPFHFRIEGHTDSVGDEAMNMVLSERRAAAVRDYLVRKFGVAGSRLEAVGLGETRMLVPTGDGVDEPRNRRVQVINLNS